MKSLETRAECMKRYRHIMRCQERRAEDARAFVRRVNSGCNGKVKYTKREAKAARDRMLSKGVKRGGIYRCDICGGWHITSHPRR